MSPFELDVIKTVHEVNRLVSCLKSLWILHTWTAVLYSACYPRLWGQAVQCWVEDLKEEIPDPAGLEVSVRLAKEFLLFC